MIGWAAIDPGVNGYVCKVLMAAKVATFDPIPVLPGNGKTEYDLAGLYRLAQSLKDYKVVVEDQGARRIQGASSAFRMGVGWGLLRAMLHVAGVPYERVQPQRWKKAMGIQSSKVYAERKKASIRRAVELFPEVDFRENDRCRVPHDGKCEARLLAEYCRRTWP